MSDAEKLIWAAAYFMQYVHLDSRRYEWDKETDRTTGLDGTQPEQRAARERQFNATTTEKARMFATETIMVLRKASREMSA